jgi:catalase
VVDALEKAGGVHPGERRNHIKGVCGLGDFVGNAEAATYSRSSLFSGKPVPVVARFSVAGGNPKTPDTARNPRGMALEFRLPELQHITMINVPVFGVATPQGFLEQTQASIPDPATGKQDPEKLKAFKAAHPESRALSEYLDQNNPPPSYADSAYFSIHTFKFMGQGDKPTLVRWRFVPQGGEKHLTDAQMKSMPADFLQKELIDRVAKGPARWDMLVTIGQPGDEQNNPSIQWPKDRKEFKAGTLTISKAMPQPGGECEKINYDPMVMAPGIAPTDDPVLRFRSPAYAVSFGRRMQGK